MIETICDPSRSHFAL